MLSQLNGAPRACTLFFLPLLILAIPLGVLLVVLQRLPAEEVQLASTDSRLLSPVSTFWCAAQEVTSSHPFYAYKVPSAPPVLRDPPHQHTFAFRFNLLKGKHYRLRYHLLTGSSLELAGCTNGWPAPFDIFFGREAMNECLKAATPSTTHIPDLSSEEDDYSDSDSNEEFRDDYDRDFANALVPRKYRAGLTGPKGKKRYCSDTLLSGQLERSPTDEEPSPSCPLGSFSFRLTANRTGKYYVLVRTDGRTEPGGVLLHVRLNRTTYELPDSVLFCRSPSACAIPLTFGAEERVVVFVSAEPDAGAALFQIKSKCQPRAAFYLVVFLLLPLLFALALLYVVRAQRRRRLIVRASSTRAAISSPTPERVSMDLEESEALKQDVGVSPPPSYRDAVRELARASSTPPPTYEELLRQPLVPVHRL